MTETKSFYSEDGKIVINLTLEEAESCAHQGPCYANVKALAQFPHIKAQLEGLDPQDVIHELKRWGYDFDRIADHDDNVERLLWIAACEIKDEARAMKCNQCEMLSINGVPCHETGCPNSGKEWDADSQQWVKVFTCPECGCQYRESESCDCMEPDDDDDWGDWPDNDEEPFG